MRNEELNSKIYTAVRDIPKGKVATYKQIAEMVGNPKLARVVGNALHWNPDHSSIPCHRVVNTKGELSKVYAFGGIEGQTKFLQEEGVEVINGKVDLSKYGI